MKQEYKLISAGAHLNEEQMNEFGSEGWELVCINPASDKEYGTNQVTVRIIRVFKRPLLLEN